MGDFLNDKELISLKLFEIGAVKFGTFTLKDGSQSPIYIDLRVLVSFPETLKFISSYLIKLSKDLTFDRIAGIPYAAIPIATAVSLESNFPLIYPRKEQKGYGTKRQIEGIFKEGEIVLVYDDLITSGGSKFEAIKPLEEAGLIVKDIVVLVDREQGGTDLLKEKGYSLHAVVKISEMLQFLKQNNKISESQFNEVNEFFKKVK